jgi:tripartite-type tricarboxylate transporter receptor subunit TctC
MRLIKLVLAAAGILACSLQAQAQLGGGKVLHVIVPFAAGGVQDILARSIGNELGALLGQTVVVENKPGAGGTVGTAQVAKAAPDGQTVVMAAASHLIAPHLYPKLGYDPAKDFVPAAYVGTASYILMIPASVPAKSAAEFIRHAKANPGKLNYASAGNGSATHLAMAYFTGLAGLDITHIPYKATGEAINEVVADRAQGVIAANIGALQFKDDKRVRLLGVTSKQRSRFVPDLPTVAESGLPGYEFTSWFGLLAPAGTPKVATDAINAAVEKLLKDPVILERLARQGIETQAISNADFSKLLAQETDKVTQIVRLSGVKPE